MKFLSQADFARKHGVSPKTVTAWKHRGYLVLGPDQKRVDVEETEKLLATRTGRGGRLKGPAIIDAPLAGVSDAPDASDPETWSLHEAARRERVAVARLRELELAREAGLVVPIADVTGAVRAEYHIVRTALLGIPSKLAHRLAVATTPEACGALLDTEIRQILTELTRDAPK